MTYSTAMGLDISHDAWHGAYSAFDRFRTALSEAAELLLIDDPAMTVRKVVDIDWNTITDANTTP